MYVTGRQEVVMVVKVVQAMTVPHSANGRSNGCKLASHLQSGKEDLYAKLVTMDRSKCATENGRHGKYEPAVTYERAGSEGSQSSMESLTAGELGLSPGENPSQAHILKGRAGEEVSVDALPEDYVSRKSRRNLVGGSAASLVDEDRGSTASEDGTDTCTRVKFMCSFGGKIFPRPSDGKLRYVGGDTKIIAVNRDTNFHDLLAKMKEVYGQNLILKYQLPDEDLDALVSVSSYEDLQNMMEEYDKLERADKSSRLRVFLFPAMENDSASILKDSAGDLRNSEQRYVDALNGISEAGSRTRMETYASSAPVYPVDNLISMDGPESWTMPRTQEQQASVPKVVHAHDVASHILRVPCGVPGSNIQSRPNTSSAPSSAPSSPPLLSRQTHGKLPVVSDMHLPYHQEALAKLGAPFSLLPTEVSYSESESYVGSGASSATASQLEPHYRNSEMRRGPESPTRKQHDTGHNDLHLRPEQRRMAESKMLRVGSHGKLSRLAELGDGIPIVSETPQIPEPFERLFHQQQQQSLHQGVWTHSDSSQESYRLQPNLPQQQGYQQQQQQPLLLRTGVQVSGHDAGYRPDDQTLVDEVLHHMPRSLSSHALATASGQSSGYQVGSAPSSPRPGYSSRHVPSAQQIPAHWAYGGAGFPEQQSYGRRKNYSDQFERFRLSSSPPKYRDNVDYTDDWLLRQHQGGNSEAAHHEQVPTGVHLGYDANVVGVLPYDLLSRPQVPLYKGQNIFQEKAVFQEHQDGGDGRRHQLPQRLDSQYIPGKQQQQHLHSAQNQRHEFHDPLLQMAEQIPGNPRYAENQLKVTDWESDEPRLRGRSRTRTMDDDFHVDAGTPRQKDVPQFFLPETSDELLSSVGDPVQSIDHTSNASFQFRPGMPTPGAIPGYGHMSRTNHVDSLAGPRYVTPRTNDSDYHVARGFRAGNNIQDMRAPAYDVSGHQYGTGGLIQGMQLPSGHRVEERSATADNSFSHQLKPFRVSDNVNLGTDIRWNGGPGPDDIRIIDRPPGLPTPHMPRVASRLSRPSSTTNIPSLVEDVEEGVHVQPYNMQGRASTLMDDDLGHPYTSRGFTSSENVLFNANAAKYGNPALKADPLPAVSTDLFTLEPTTGIVPSSQYLVQKPDLPSIKTTATQVPSVEDDLGTGGTTSTSGSSSPSGSHKGSRETSLAHLAEDMASCVLEPSPTKVSCPAGKEESKHVCILQDQLSQRIDINPTVWDNPLHSDEENHSGGQHGKVAPERGPLVKGEPDPTANVSSDSESEDAQPQLPRVYSSKNIVDTAAEEAREHGLQTIRNDDLEELRELGSGTFGTVYHGKWRGTDVAIKRIKASCFAGRPSEQERLVEILKTPRTLAALKSATLEEVGVSSMIADFWREARNLGNLHHPNVVAFYGVVADGPGGTLATVTEYMINGSLKQVLQKKDRTIDRRKRHLIAMDAAFGMEYLHEKKVVHFDLKCENLLVNMRDPHRPVCKVGDLGLSKVKRQTMVSGGVRGTLPWMAPELMNNSSNFVTEKVDVFSFGIVMWELLTGEEPYANMHYGAIIGGIVNNSLRPAIPSWCDPRWRSLMERCWASDPATRPSFSDIASELRSMSEGLRPKAC